MVVHVDVQRTPQLLGIAEDGLVEEALEKPQDGPPRRAPDVALGEDQVDHPRLPEKLLHAHRPRAVLEEAVGGVQDEDLQVGDQAVLRPREHVFVGRQGGLDGRHGLGVAPEPVLEAGRVQVGHLGRLLEGEPLGAGGGEGVEDARQEGAGVGHEDPRGGIGVFDVGGVDEAGGVQGAGVVPHLLQDGKLDRLLPGFHAEGIDDAHLAPEGPEPVPDVQVRVPWVGVLGVEDDGDVALRRIQGDAGPEDAHRLPPARPGVGDGVNALHPWGQAQEEAVLGLALFLPEGLGLLQAPPHPDPQVPHELALLGLGGPWKAAVHDGLRGTALHQGGHLLLGGEVLPVAQGNRHPFRAQEEHPSQEEPEGKPPVKAHLPPWESPEENLGALLAVQAVEEELLAPRHLPPEVLRPSHPQHALRHFQQGAVGQGPHQEKPQEAPKEEAQDLPPGNPLPDGLIRDGRVHGGECSRGGVAP